MKTIYIADDGTKFNDKDACREYELTKNVLPSVKANVTGYTLGGIEVPFNDNATSWYDNSYFIVVHNDMTEEEEKYWGYELGYTMPTKKGVYRYEDDMWINYFEEKTEFENNWAPIIEKIENHE
jgi:hypothetical protein